MSPCELFQMYDALVGAAAERQVRIAKLCLERTVHKSIDIWKNLAEARVGLNLLLGKSGVAPDGLAGLLLDAACKLCESLNLIQRVTSRKSDISKLVLLNDVKKLLHCHLISALEIPRLRIMATRTRMSTARTIYRRAQPWPIRHGLICYIQYSDFHVLFN